MNRGRRKRERLAAHHVISKQYKHQGDNQHHGTSILLGREREIQQFVQPLTTVTVSEDTTQ